MNDWKEKHAKDADESLKHDLVKGVVEEYVDNMRGYVDLDKGLPSYGLHKVMHYVAMVARAQALGFDPNLLKLSNGEATEEMLKMARLMVERGTPVMVITDEALMTENHGQ